jgi:hypothetical protein
VDILHLRAKVNLNIPHHLARKTIAEHITSALLRVVASLYRRFPHTNMHSHQMVILPIREHTPKTRTDNHHQEVNIEMIGLSMITAGLDLSSR